MKKSLLTILSFLLLVSCGNKSEISSATPARKMSEAYGDGQYTIMPMVLPLSDETIESFDSPFSKIGFILGGFSKIFADLGATIGMGKMQISLTQKIPEIPEEYFKEVRFKRIFFYIEPVKGPRDTRFWNRFIFGKDDVNFKFINRLAVKFSTVNVDPKLDWSPTVETKMFNNKDFLPLNQIFLSERTHASIVDLSKARELVFLTFDKKKKDNYLKNDQFGSVFIVKTTSPSKTRSYLAKHPKLHGMMNRIHILNKSILVELKKDRIIEEHFKAVLGEEGDYLENLGVEFIEKCTPNTCFDFNVSELNLLPIMKKSNAIKIDAFIEAGKVPESFQLKGFIEAELKLNLTF